MQLKKRAYLYLAFLLLGLVWIGLTRDKTGVSTANRIPAPQAGFLAPDFKLQTLDGRSLALSDLRGQAVLVNYWASWCGPCQAEMPAMQKVYEAYHDQGFEILAVNATNQDQLAAVQSFVDSHGLTFPVLLDVDGQVGGAYQVHSLPTSFFVRPDGTIEEVVIGGPMAEAMLRTRIEKLLEAIP